MSDAVSVDESTMGAEWCRVHRGWFWRCIKDWDCLFLYKDAIRKELREQIAQEIKNLDTRGFSDFITVEQVLFHAAAAARGKK